MRLPSVLRRARDLWRHSGELAGLAADRRSRSRMRLAVLLMPLKSRVPSLRARTLTLRILVGGVERRVHLRDRLDFTLLHEIFLEGEYAVSLPAAPKAILDLGAHVGFSTLWFRERFPQARILAVEPNPASFERLQRNLEGLPQVQLDSVAVGGRPGTAWFDVGQESWRTMLVSDPAERSAIQVPVKTIDDLARGAGFEPAETLIKIDVEGAEWDVLSSTPGLTGYLGIVGDLHRDLLPVPPDRFFALFDGLRVEGWDSPSSFSAVRSRTPASAS